MLPVFPGICCRQSNLCLTAGGRSFRLEVAWRKRISYLQILNDFRMTRDIEV